MTSNFLDYYTITESRTAAGNYQAKGVLTPGDRLPVPAIRKDALNRDLGWEGHHEVCSQPSHSLRNVRLAIMGREIKFALNPDYTHSLTHSLTHLDAVALPYSEGSLLFLMTKNGSSFKLQYCIDRTSRVIQGRVPKKENLTLLCESTNDFEDLLTIAKDILEKKDHTSYVMPGPVPRPPAAIVGTCSNTTNLPTEAEEGTPTMLPVLNKRLPGRLFTMTKVAAILLIGYSLGYKASRTGFGPEPSTAWSAIQSVISYPLMAEHTVGNWEPAKVGPTGNLDIERIYDGGMYKDFDPVSGTYDVEEKIIRRIRNWFGWTLRVEVKQPEHGPHLEA